MRLTRLVRVRPRWRSSEELVFERVEGRFDPLPDATERAEAWRLVAAVGAQQPAAKGCDVVLELSAGEAFVGDHGLAWLEHALGHLGGQEPLGRVRGGELEPDRQPVGRAEQVEAKAPEPAAVRAAVAVAADPGQLRATNGLA